MAVIISAEHDPSHSAETQGDGVSLDKRQIHAPRADTTGPHPSLITEFIEPSSCTLQFKFVSNVTSSELWDSSTGTTLHFTSDVSGPNSTDCQAPGWNQQHPTFSPGVCPGNWTYYHMTAIKTHKTWVTNAICCASEFSPNLYAADSIECISSDYASTTLDLTTAYTTVYGGPDTSYAHAPYFVQWQDSETTLLPYSVPELTHGRSVSAWAPGETLSPTDGFDQHHCEGLCFTGGYLALVIALPLVAFFLILGCCVVCCRRLHKSNRRKRVDAIHSAQVASIEASQRRALEEMELDPDTHGETYGLKSATKTSAVARQSTVQGSTVEAKG